MLLHVEKFSQLFASSAQSPCPFCANVWLWWGFGLARGVAVVAGAVVGWLVVVAVG